MKLSDLQVVVQIIDLAAEKGIFKGADLKTVGEVRERIIDFVKTNSQQVEGSQAEGASNESIDAEAK
jgi:hypothetical protein